MFDKAMETVLESAKYDYLTGRRENLRDRIVNMLLDIIKWIFNKLNININLSTAGINSNLIANIFFIGAAIFFVGIISLILFYSLKKKRRKAAFDEIFTVFKNNKLSFNQLMDLAKSCERDKNYRDALRYQYIALIMTIINHNIIHVPDSMTGSQLIQKINAHAPELAEGVSSTVNTFYLLYFGNKKITEDMYEKHKAKYNGVIGRAQRYEQKN